MAVVYVALVVRSYFLSQAETDLAFAGVMLSRANLCEILAIKLLNRFATNYLQLVAVLTTAWNPLAGAAPQVIEDVKSALGAHGDDFGDAQSAIEVTFTPFLPFLPPTATDGRLYPGKVFSGRPCHTESRQRHLLWSSGLLCRGKSVHTCR